jgi:hypothetical protein
VDVRTAARTRVKRWQNSTSQVCDFGSPIIRMACKARFALNLYYFAKSVSAVATRFFNFEVIRASF